jgi:hypothetical protein
MELVGGLCKGTIVGTASGTLPALLGFERFDCEGRLVNDPCYGQRNSVPVSFAFCRRVGKRPIFHIGSLRKALTAV